eukprot:1493731-Pleurochrysis_carterae.AAC.1
MVRQRSLARIREKERAELAAERADLEFLCYQDYFGKLRRQQSKKKHKSKSASACSTHSAMPRLHVYADKHTSAANSVSSCHFHCFASSKYYSAPMAGMWLSSHAGSVCPALRNYNACFMMRA